MDLCYASKKCNVWNGCNLRGDLVFRRWPQRGEFRGDPRCPQVERRRCAGRNNRRVHPEQEHQLRSFRGRLAVSAHQRSVGSGSQSHAFQWQGECIHNGHRRNPSFHRYGSFDVSERISGAPCSSAGPARSKWTFKSAWFCAAASAIGIAAGTTSAEG